MAMQHPLKAQWPLLAALATVALLSLMLAFASGSADIPIARLLRLLVNDDHSIEHRILFQLRIPRSLSAFGIGALLALAGVLMQVLLRNPLGDPYILGLSGGAAVAVLGAMLLGLPLAWHAPAAFLGAMISMMLLLGLAHQGRWNNHRLLLTGVILAAGWSALISFVLSLSPPVRLPGMLFWLLGDLSDADTPLLPLIIMPVGLLLSLTLAPQLNRSLAGAQRALSLGVNTPRLHLWIYLLASAMTATAVSIAGTIGFIGLLAPHMVRLLGGNDHRILLPGAALLGGSLLVLADTAARTLVAPLQLPVGVLTALLGVPFFLWLLHRSYGTRA